MFRPGVSRDPDSEHLLTVISCSWFRSAAKEARQGIDASSMYEAKCPLETGKWPVQKSKIAYQHLPFKFLTQGLCLLSVISSSPTAFILRLMDYVVLVPNSPCLRLRVVLNG
jgi:hypothetical protein